MTFESTEPESESTDHRDQTDEELIEEMAMEAMAERRKEERGW